MSINSSFDFLLQWHVTERCNLHCSHCYQTGIELQEMPLPAIQDVIGEISSTLDIWNSMYGIHFSPSVNITGGEPFIRDDIFAILHEFNIRGFDIFVLTNGILVDKEKADKLRSLNVKGIQISIEGPRKIHESIRGNNSFSASVAGVRHLLGAGLEVTLNVTLSSINADYFNDIFQLASALGVQKLGFSRLVPAGRGETMVTNMLSPEDVMDLYNKIFSMNTKGIKIVTGDPVASQLRMNGKKDDCGDIALGGCAAGISGITILADGTLVPCRRMPVPLGNINKDSLRQVWAESGVLNALRNRSMYKGKCRSCKQWAHCRGCRAIAYAHSGAHDYLAQDPQCFIN